MRYAFAILFLICFGNSSFAQDVITLKNGDKEDVKIIGVSESDITFYYYNDPEKVEVTMKRSLIREISYEYGREEFEENPSNNESYFVDDRKNNVMLNFSSVVNKSTNFSYEHAIDPNASFGGVVKIFGLGTGSEVNRSGFGLEANYKVKTAKIFKKDEYRPDHILQGLYLRPNIGYSNNKSIYNENTTYESEEKYSYVYGGFDFGKEWIFSNRLSLDWFTGINFFGGSFKESDDGNEVTDPLPLIYDGNMVGADNFALRYGLQVGFLFD